MLQIFFNTVVRSHVPQYHFSSCNFFYFYLIIYELIKCHATFFFKCTKPVIIYLKSMNTHKIFLGINNNDLTSFSHYLFFLSSSTLYRIFFIVKFHVMLTLSAPPIEQNL